MITEPHFTPGQLAERWSVSPDWIRRRFRREHGVVRLGSSWRIPASVAERVYRSCAIGGPSPRPAKFRAARAKDGAIVLRPKER